mmetsp:Transcript_20248/g.22635  ORF Transcript_20248/g.22635 Transcript_20248/m.22635 type:complete len:153 (-) Transcript_20248:40-498(-)
MITIKSGTVSPVNVFVNDRNQYKVSALLPKDVKLRNSAFPSFGVCMCRQSNLNLNKDNSPNDLPANFLTTRSRRNIALPTITTSRRVNIWSKLVEVNDGDVDGKSNNGYRNTLATEEKDKEKIEGSMVNNSVLRTHTQVIITRTHPSKRRLQ